MEEKSFQKYFILWFSQLISGLGSSMTGFALVLWAYGQSHSALSVSLMSFCNYVPYVLLNLFVGNFIDRHKKKSIMLVSDSIAAAAAIAASLPSPFVMANQNTILYRKIPVDMQGR